ncbi:hypothetical protein OPKNFCMD_6355 [Methylobacterium crusticola]|uniref:Uncharacterized protein n=1 Tax=Methylobacterium crusticola TaxID=1697972 RepID=A0ABQ4R7B5_9HYPH|nr:hypothetical protein OPKNFCMD_6355 [Methylobacterium crusticola]
MAGHPVEVVKGPLPQHSGAGLRRATEEEPSALRSLQDGAIHHLRGILARQHRVAILLAGA